MAEITESFESPTDERSIARMFDRISGRYDLLNRLLSARQDVRWRNHLIAKIPYRPEGTFLDMATGTGDVLLSAVQRHPEYAGFIGADISEGMLSQARVKTRQVTSAQAKKIEWRVMSAEVLDLADRSCDCISISFGLRNVVHKDLALKEFARVLKPSGILLILEFFTPQTGVMANLFQFYFHWILPVIGRLLSEKQAYTYLPKSVASFYTPGELRDALRAEGLIVEYEKNFLFGACRLVAARKI